MIIINRTQRIQRRRVLWYEGRARDGDSRDATLNLFEIVEGYYHSLRREVEEIANAPDPYRTRDRGDRDN